MEPSAGTVLRLWFEEVWNRQDASRIAAYLAPEGVVHSLDMSGADARGPAAFQAFQQQILAGFAGIHVTVNDLVEDGDRAAARWTMRMTHSGQGVGEPTGETVTVDGISLVRMADGMIVEAWDAWDRLRLLTACRVLQPA
jgi:predicted ester cyclase